MVWQSAAGNGNLVVDFTSSQCTAATGANVGFNCAISVLSLAGTYSNEPYTSIKAQFLLNAQTLPSDPTTSLFSPPSAQSAFTKADAAQLTLVSSNTAGTQIVAHFSLSAHNQSGTLYYLQVQQDDPKDSNAFDDTWTNTSDIVQTIQMTTPGVIPASLTIGANYRVRILTQRLNTGLLPAGAGPQQTGQPNGFDAASNVGKPGAILALNPTVTINQKFSRQTSALASPHCPLLSRTPHGRRISITRVTSNRQ